MLGISSHSGTSGGGSGAVFFMDGHQMAANYAHQALSQLDQIAHQFSGYHQQQHHHQTIHQPIPQHPQQQQQQQQMQSPPIQLQCQSKNGKKSRADYSNALCTICSAPADGLHYGAISCRSCNAFFRRAITFKQTFICRKGGNCDVDVSVRCACRSCRLTKCKAAGMRETDVQPKRDPTGSQKNRRAPKRQRGMGGENGTLLTIIKKEVDAAESSPKTLLPSVDYFPLPDKGLMTCLAGGTEVDTAAYHRMLSPTSASFPPSAESGIFEDASVSGTSSGGGSGIQFLKAIKKEEGEDEEEEEEEEEEDYEEEEDEEGGGGADEDDAKEEHHQQRSAAHFHHSGTMMSQRQGTSSTASSTTRMASAAAQAASAQFDPEQAAFDSLIRDYREHMTWMNRSMMPIEDFLAGRVGNSTKWRKIEPEDVEQLSKVELSGLMYWIEKLEPFQRLDAKDKEVLFKRYSIRKLCLDHFYTASRYPDLLAKGHFAMPNNTYVPPDATGFETVKDDAHTREAKFQVLRPTIDRLWETIVLPFAQLKITEAEVVALHLLLMWSPRNDRLMNEEVRRVMGQRRDWTIKRLFKHYQLQNETDAEQSEPSVRLGEILLLMPELELVCDMHCKDFQVAQLFEFCNMSDYWYESYCYNHLNITA